MWSSISRWILESLGWSVQGADHVLQLKYSVIAAAPHTSNWDFPLGILVRSAYKIDSKYLGKKSLFRWPIGYFFKRLGGYPVDRSRSNNLVDDIVAIFRKHDTFSISIAPQGTRTPTNTFKSGFYYIAEKGGFPIIMSAFDFKHKKVTFSEPFYPTGDFTSDMHHIYSYFDGVHGKNYTFHYSPETVGDKNT